MLIDLVYIILIVVAVFKGYSKGFVVAIFSFLAIFIGLAAALKLSATVAVWLGKSTNLGERLLPVISFALVFIGVAVITRIVAKLIEKTLQIALLGFVNRLGGVLLYAILYTIIFSIILFFADKIDIIKSDTKASSYTYHYTQPWGPKAISLFSEVIPFFKHTFEQLENFFDGVVHKK